MENKIFRLVESIVGIFFLLILLAMVIFDNRFFYMYQNNCVVPNLLFLIVGIALYMRIFMKAKVTAKDNGSSFKPKGMNVWRTRRNLYTCSAVLFLVQIIFTWNIFFKTGWDCQILVKAAQAFAFEGTKIGADHYFSLYPNNVFLVGFFSLILKITNITKVYSDYFVLVVIGAFFVALAGYFMGDLVRILTNKPGLVYGSFAVFALLTGLSPWVSVPYSDTYSILFPVLVVWIFVTRNDRATLLSWFLIPFTAIIGYFIKPTVILTLFVIVPVAIVHFFGTVIFKYKKLALKKMVCFFVGGFLAIIVAFGLNTHVKNVLGFTPNESESFTAIHYFMMGMNVESGGGYNQQDVNFSASASSVAERNQQDLELGLTRIKEMGVKRFVSFMVQKALTNFNDGSFAWGNEGEFYWYIQERDNRIAPILRSWFYEDGSYYKGFIALNQGLWFIAFMGLSLTILSLRYSTDYRYTVVRLSVFAIFVFLMIFEARARYIYLYSPLIYVAEATGINSLITRIVTKKKEGNADETHVYSTSSRNRRRSGSQQ